MFTKRLLSGIILVLLALFVVVSGGSILFFATGIISLVGLFEFYRVLGIHKHTLGLLGYLLAAVYYGLLWFDGKQHVEFVIIAAVMLLMSIYVMTFPTYKTDEVTGAFFGVFYVAVMLSYLYQTRKMADGAYLVWLIFISSWGCDTCAYCTGMLFGKHKLAPVLSPKKSIEGAVGGAVGAAVIGFVYALIFKGHMLELENPEISCALACGIAAVISQIGDLAASAVKRNHNVKDYGHLIPGHGGILDRFDSMLFTAPAIFFALTFLR
ncbi:phosphatidate cytidylyltransferase [Clostridium sp. AM58-1XD]|uniref:phosphatidate cytidylyltransferase n=1 Tax=Clostridium sp. AM58-1XD TaxID=2292307 RepID=UPI000E4A89A5|nr:phosphatidate cytidylyltransferase [Clostridium sp. AM58-1XD]RGZ01555.1 phosphatidate cytidylyltransferase [Clostridium sp. AM58-1XD]